MTDHVRIFAARLQELNISTSNNRNDGTQAIRRAAAILKYVAKSPEQGAGLREIAETMRLSRSTTHRILKCLVNEQLLCQSEDAKRYTIGGLTAELGLAAQNWKQAILEWRPAIERISAETGVTAYLMGRSGNETICLAKAESASVLRVIPVDVGQRRPLGVGAGATALLAALPEEECESTITSIEPYLPQYSSTKADDIREMVRQTRRTGFAESSGRVVKGVYGLGIAVPSAHGPSTLALSLAAHESVVTKSKIASWRKCLTQAVGKMAGLRDR